MKNWKKVLSVLTSIILLVLSSMPVLADVTEAHTAMVEVYYGDTKAELSHAVFEDNQMLYFPLRDLLNACQIPDEMITYENGVIRLSFWSPVLAAMPDKADQVEAYLTVGQPNIVFPLDQETENGTQNQGVRTTTHPTLLVGDTTYVPLGTLIRIKQFDVNQYWYDGSERDRLCLQLLSDLKIVQNHADGTYDVLLSTLPQTSEENKYLPTTYYEEGERVLIATGEEMDAYGHHYDEVNGYIHPLDPIKRILVDEAGKVIAVVPVENQYHEALNVSVNGAVGGGISWSQYAENNGIVGLVDSDGNVVKTDEILHDLVTVDGTNRMNCVYYLSRAWTVE